MGQELLVSGSRELKGQKGLMVSDGRGEPLGTETLKVNNYICAIPQHQALAI